MSNQYRYIPHEKRNYKRKGKKARTALSRRPIPTLGNLVRILRTTAHSITRGIIRTPAIFNNLLLDNMTRHGRVVVGSAGNLSGQFFKGLAFRFWNQKSSEDTAEHEEGEDLHDVVEPRGGIRVRRSTLSDERAKDTLGDNGSNFSGRSTEAVRGRAVAGREHFTRDDEGGGIGAEVEEELGEDVETEEAII